MNNPIQPSHYQSKDGSEIECCDAQRAMLGNDGYRAYLGTFTGSAVRCAGEEANCKANTKARAYQARADNLAGAA